MQDKKIPRRRKYRDCGREDGNCNLCPLAANGFDCRGRKITALERWRMVRNISQGQLAAESGVNIQVIYNIEWGKGLAENIRLTHAVALAKVLRIGPEQLLDVDLNLKRGKFVGGDPAQQEQE